MTAPSVRSTSGIAYGSRTSTVVNAPASIVAGDLLLAFFVMGSGGGATFEPTTLPSGFSLLTTFTELLDLGGFRTRCWMYGKTATGSEPASYTFAYGSAQSTCVTVLAIADADLSAPATTTNGGNALGTTARALSITTTVADTLILFVGTDWGDTANNLIPPTGITPTFTENWDAALLYVASGVISGAGPTGDKTQLTNSASDAGGHPWWAGLVAVKPAVAAAGPVTLSTKIIDAGLGYVSSNANRIYVCSQRPASYAEAITTYALGYKDFGVGGVASAPQTATGGRKIVTNAVTAGTVTTGGTPAAWAIVDTANSLLLAAGELSGAVAVTTSDTWTLDPIGIVQTSTLGAGPSYTFDADTNAWVTATGVAVTTARKLIVNDLILGLKADGIWAKLDRLWLFAAADTQSALLGLKLSTATAVNSPAFVADRGFTGAASAYIDCNYNPSTDAVNWAQNNACFFAWNNTAGQVANALVGANVANRNKLYPEHATNDTRWSINVVSSQAATTGIVGNTGLWAVNRTASTATQLYLNGIELATATMGSGALGSAIYVFRDATIYTTRQCCCFGNGANLSIPEQVALYNRIRTYMSGVGVP